MFEDDEADTLGGSAGSDWFFANLDGSGVRDLVTDLECLEAADDTNP